MWREIEQMNYFCSAYPEVVKGEVGQSHAGDVFWELLQDLRVLCLQVDKKKKRITSHKPPKSTACYWLKATHMMLVLHACFTRPWMWPHLYFEYLRGSQSLVVVALNETLYCELERFQRCNLSESLWLHWIYFWFRFGALNQECAAPAN